MPVKEFVENSQIGKYTIVYDSANSQNVYIEHVDFGTYEDL